MKIMTAAVLTALCVCVSGQCLAQDPSEARSTRAVTPSHLQVGKGHKSRLAKHAKHAKHKKLHAAKKKVAMSKKVRSVGDNRRKAVAGFVPPPSTSSATTPAYVPPVSSAPFTAGASVLDVTAAPASEATAASVGGGTAAGSAVTAAGVASGTVISVGVGVAAVVAGVIAAAGSENDDGSPGTTGGTTTTMTTSTR